MEGKMDRTSMVEKRENVDLVSIWRTFISHKRIIAFCTIAGLTVAILASWLMPRTYKAEALLRLSLEQPKFSVFQENTFTPPAQVVDPVSSELEIIRSRTLLRDVAEKRGLFVVPLSNSPFGFEEQRVSPEFKGERFVLTVYPDGRVELRDRKERVVKGRLGEALQSEYFSFKVMGSPPKEKMEVPIEVRSVEAVVKSLRRNLKVYQRGKTNIAVVSVKARDPILAADLANEVCETYVEFSLSDQKKVARSMREFTEMQLKQVEEELARDEKALMKAKEKAGPYSILTLGNMKGPAAEIIKNLATLERNRANALAAQKEAETKLELIRKELEKGGVFKKHTQMASLPVVTNNPIVQDLKKRLTILEADKARLLQTYTENHPEVRAITMKIEQVKEELQSAVKEMVKEGPSASDPLYIDLVTSYVSTEAELEALKNRVQVYDDLIKREEAKIESLPAKEAEMTRLLRKVETGRSLYSLLLSKLQEAKIAEAKEVGDARIIDMALPPLRPISPKIPINIFLGFSLGLFLGLFIAMAREALDNSVRSVLQLERITGSIALGGIPYTKELRSKKKEPLPKGLIIHHHPHSPESESMRSLATRLKFASFGSPLKSLFITSSVAQEGKTTITANLAYSLAERGYRTIAVDADFRKPGLSKLFGIKGELGVSDVILKEVELGKAIKQGPHEKLFVLPSGSSVENPAQILGSPKMAALLTRLETDFDFVIFDTPPLLPFTDALELGTQLDGAILVTKARSTERKIVEESVKLIQMANIRLIGVILNGIKKDGESEYYYYYRYSYYYYPPTKRSQGKKIEGTKTVKGDLQ
jgi:capsular exopolysaccharide synthesis family protein